MLAFIENPNLLIKEFNELIKVSQRKAFITIGIELQKDEIEVLKKYREDLSTLKKSFVDRELENEANLVFCIENAVFAIQCELEMLVHIKEDCMSEAWSKLVLAQVTVGSAMRNFPFDPDYLTDYLNRLDVYEKLLFPHFNFSSAGYIIKRSFCSICKADYGQCEHIKGKVYMGQMCCREIVEADLEEVSYVENPANKLCRDISYTVNGKTFDVMTLREIKKEE